MEKTLTFNELERYRAQINLREIGINGQRKLKKSAVLIVGVGGLGSAVLWYLAAAGIGKIGIVDHDEVELNNLQRQILYTPADLNKSKSEVAKQRIEQFNPQLDIESHVFTVTAKNAPSLIQDYQLIIDASDNFATRYVINDACVALKKPFIYGGIQHFEGQVAFFDPSISLINYRTLYPQPPLPNSRVSCAQGGIISALPGIIGSIQALEAIKYLVGSSEILTSKLLRINALTWSTRIYQIEHAT